MLTHTPLMLVMCTLYLAACDPLADCESPCSLASAMQVDQLVQRLEMLKDRITSTEKFLDTELDHRRVPAAPQTLGSESSAPVPTLDEGFGVVPRRRNQLVSLDIVVTAVMTMFAFVSMVWVHLGYQPHLPRVCRVPSVHAVWKHNGLALFQCRAIIITRVNAVQRRHVGACLR